MTKKKKTKIEPLESDNPEVILSINRQPLKEGQEIVYAYTAEYFRRQGALGGAIGGKRTAAKLSPEERSASAKKAVQARWKKYREQKEKESK